MELHNFEVRFSAIDDRQHGTYGLLSAAGADSDLQVNVQ
jgi:hypothetical protein